MKTLMTIVAFLSTRVEDFHFNRKSDVQVAWYVPYLWTFLRLYGWIDFSGSCEGVMVKGDNNATATNGLTTNLRTKYTRRYGAYFKVSDEHARAGYYIGYKPTIGTCQASVCMTRCNERKFMEKIGRETCYFFAIDLQGHEIPIKLVGTFPVSDNIIQQAQTF